MIHFDCPTTATGVTVAADAFLSTHRTAAGRVAYLRCACDGLAVFARRGRDGWRPVGHAAGHHADAAAPVAVTRCA